MNEPWGKGIYSIPDVRRLTGIPSYSIRRWIKGYRYNYKDCEHTSDPLWVIDFQPIEGAWSLSFADLIELKFVKAFMDEGLSLKTIRHVLIHATKRFTMRRPFCSRRFMTDGRTVFLEVESLTGEKRLEEFLKRQVVFKDIMSPFLRHLDIEDDVALRWWPLSHDKRVVIDPERSFGRPIVAQEGIPTESLAQAVKANGSIDVVSEWYNVSKESITDAIEFESQLAA